MSTCLTDLSILLVFAVFDNCIPQRQLSSYSVTRSSLCEGCGFLGKDVPSSTFYTEFLANIVCPWCALALAVFWLCMSLIHNYMPQDCD